MNQVQGEQELAEGAIAGAAKATLSEKRPKGRAGVRVLEPSRKDGNRVLRSDDGRGFAEVDDRELQLWELLDGEHSIEQLVMECLAWSEPASADWVAATLARFARSELLEGDWLGAAKVRSKLLFRLRGTTALPGLAAPLRGLGTLLFMITPVAALLPLGVVLALGQYTVMPYGASPWTFILWLLTILTASEAARAMGYLAAGQPLKGIGIGLSCFCPVPSFDRPDVSPSDHLRPALWGIGCKVLISGTLAVLYLLLDAGLFQQGAVIGLLALVLDLSPLFPSDGLTLMNSWSGDSKIRDRAAQFMTKRFLPKLLTRETFFPEEQRMVLLGGLMAIWSVIALRVGTTVFSNSLDGFSMALGVGASVPTMMAGIGILLASIAAMLYGLIQILITPLRLLTSTGLRGEAVARWMLPIGILGSTLVLLPVPQLTGALYFVLSGTLIYYVFLQFRAIPGSRLGVGYIFLWMGLIFHVLARGPHYLQAMGAFDVSVIKPEMLQLMEEFVPAGFILFGLLATLEAFNSVLKRYYLIVGAAPVVIGAIVAASPSQAGHYPLTLIALSLAPAGALLLAADRAATPMVNYWRPFCLAIICMTTSLWLQPSRGGQLGADLRTYLAGLFLAVAGMLAARAMFAVPMPPIRRPEGHSLSKSDRQALWEGGAHVFRTIIGMTQFFLGHGRADRIAAVFNRSGGIDKVFPLQIEDGEPMLQTRELPDVLAISSSLRRGLRILESEIVGTAGHNFFDRALAVSAEGLYMHELHLVQQHVLPASRRKSSNAQLMEELSRIPLFRELTAKQIDEMTRVLHQERFTAGEAVITQGENGERFYVVSRGRLNVIVEDKMGYRPVVAQLGPGDCFGEMALLGSGERMATVEATSPVEVISLGKDEFDKYLPNRENVTAMIRHGGFLLKVPLFATMPSSIVSSLAACLSMESFSRGATIVSEGQSIDRMLLVQDGSVSAGNGELGPGESFGQEVIAGPFSAPKEIKATADSAVLWLSPNQIRSTIRGWLDEFENIEGLAARTGQAGWNTR